MDESQKNQVLNLLRSGNSINQVADSLGIERHELHVSLGNEVIKFSQRLISEEVIQDFFGFDDEDWVIIEKFYKSGKAEAQIRIQDVMFNDAISKKDAKLLIRFLRELV